MMKRISLFIGLLLLCSVVNAQYSPVTWSYTAKKTMDTEAIIYLKAKIEDGWHLYSVNQAPGGPLKTTFTFLPSPDFAISGSIWEPRPISRFDKTFEIRIDYFEKEVVFQQKVKLLKAEPIIRGKVEFMVCTEQSCLPPVEVEFSVPVKLSN